MMYEIEFLLQLISAMQRLMNCELMFNVSNQYGIKWIKMKCALMFNISNHYGIKSLNNPLHLEPCNVMFKVISDIMAHCSVMWNSIVIAINLCNAKKMICALMLITNNHYEIKFLSNIL